ncbi:hypothetical protein EV561_10388 [Rhizobium sp. BK376]|nr:hypothetical protein EV561_10388 [Rhizobium sp. BK376]
MIRSVGGLRMVVSRFAALSIHRTEHGEVVGAVAFWLQRHQ